VLLALLTTLWTINGCAPELGTDPADADADGDGLSLNEGDCDDSDAAITEPVFDRDCEGSYERMVLNEVFTGSNCGPCLGADAQILDVLHENEGRYVLLSYQIGSDPYVTAEGVARRMSYLPPEASSYSIPWVQADGWNGFHPVEVNADQGYLDEDFDEFSNEPCHLGMEIDVSVKRVVGPTKEAPQVTARVRLLPGLAYPSEDLVLHTIVVEGTTYLNVGSNGQTEFHHVMKKMMAGANGLPIDPLVRGEAVDFEQSFTFQGSYDDQTGISDMLNHNSAHTVEEFDDLTVIAFVQDAQSRQVHQSIWSGQ
jgi:hypothetical protein